MSFFISSDLIVTNLNLKKKTFSKLTGKRLPRSPVFSKVAVVDGLLYEKDSLKILSNTFLLTYYE